MYKLYSIAALIILMFTTPLSSNSYGETVLSHYFQVKIPTDKKIPNVIESLQNNYKSFQPGKNDCSQSYYGILPFSKDAPEFLWVYRNKSIHSGVFAILNSNLEVIYLKADMGCLVDIQLKDFMGNGKQVLMVTHGAGGTGVYSKITDLITYTNGILELKGSLLNEHKDCNIITGGDMQPCIRCYAEKIGPDLKIFAEASVGSKSLTEQERDQMTAYLKKNYGLDLGKAMPNSSKVLIKDLDLPHIESSQSICPGFIEYGYAWPTIKKKEK